MIHASLVITVVVVILIFLILLFCIFQSVSVKGHSSLFLSVNILMDPFVNALCPLLLLLALMLKWFQIYLVGAPSSHLLHPFDILLPILSTSLQKCFSIAMNFFALALVLFRGEEVLETKMYLLLLEYHYF